MRTLVCMCTAGAYVVHNQIGGGMGVRTVVDTRSLILLIKKHKSAALLIIHKTVMQFFNWINTMILVSEFHLHHRR
jgi:hypothetical protein